LQKLLQVQPQARVQSLWLRRPREPLSLSCLLPQQRKNKRAPQRNRRRRLQWLLRRLQQRQLRLRPLLLPLSQKCLLNRRSLLPRRLLLQSP
jgi:hypothetical protein